MRRLSLFTLVLALSCGGKQQTSGPGPLPPDDEPDPREATPVEPDDKLPPEEAGPKEPEEPPPAELAFPEEDYRKERPAVGQARALEQPKLERFKLKNGVQVVLVERHEIPTVSIDLTFEGGNINDPAGKEGMADLCMNLLDDGTEKLEKIAFEEAQADIASSVSAWASEDQQGIAAATMSRYLDTTLDLWAETVLTPGLRDEDHQRNVKQAKAAIQQAKGSPASVAGRLYGGVFYGEKHPLGKMTTEASVEAVTAADCKAYVAAWLKPTGARLYVVGDISRKQIEEKIGGRLAGWKGAPKKSAAVGAAKPRKGRIFFVDVPGAAQSQIYLVHPGPQRKAGDYFPTRIAAAIFGGGFASRMNMDLREKRGYAYGAGGGFRYTRTLGTMMASASVRTDATKASVQSMYNELVSIGDPKYTFTFDVADCAEKPESEGAEPKACVHAPIEISDEELKREKEGAILALPAQFATGSSVLGSFRTLDYYGLPQNYYATFIKKIQAVDKKAVVKAAKTHFRPEKAQFLIVGDGAKVLDGLKALLASGTIGKGDLVILDIDGNVVAPQK
jgi:predicted Zn-dependent peptidase